MNRGFREDENELPYLVWETRDENHHSKSRNYGSSNREKAKTDDEKLDEILSGLYLSVSHWTLLKNKLTSFLNSKDCTGLTAVEQGFGQYTFVFTRENEYVRTTDEFVFDSNYEGIRRIFVDCYTYHNHDNLVNNPRFQDLIKKTGMEFIKCVGGYVTDYSMAADEFALKDEIDVRVCFKMGSKERIYRLDLNKMELSKDYSEINI